MKIEWSFDHGDGVVVLQRNMIYQNIEIRAEVFKFKLFLFPSRFGVLGLFDVGRVFSDNDHTSKLIRGLHSGYGGGVWMEMFSKLVISGTYAHGEENLFNLTFGFLY